MLPRIDSQALRESLPDRSMMSHRVSHRDRQRLTQMAEGFMTLGNITPAGVIACVHRGGDRPDYWRGWIKRQYEKLTNRLSVLPSGLACPKQGYSVSLEPDESELHIGGDFIFFESADVSILDDDALVYLSNGLGAIEDVLCEFMLIGRDSMLDSELVDVIVDALKSDGNAPTSSQAIARWAADQEEIVDCFRDIYGIDDLNDIDHQDSSVFDLAAFQHHPRLKPFQWEARRLHKTDDMLLARLDAGVVGQPMLSAWGRDVASECRAMQRAAPNWDAFVSYRSDRMSAARDRGQAGLSEGICLAVGHCDYGLYDAANNHYQYMMQAGEESLLPLNYSDPEEWRYGELAVAGYCAMVKLLRDLELTVKWECQNKEAA